eukprot:COSAG01_NODE_9272_length_2496_cov_4.721736_1_plen_757_part_01
MNSAMEPEPEDEEQAAAGAEAPDGSAVLAARVDVAGHEVAVDSTTLDVSGWKLTVAQVREVAGALSQLRCLRELVLDGVPVSGSTPRHGDFQYGVKAVDADLGTFRVMCEGLRACQGLASFSLKKCYLGPQALAQLADLIKVMAVVNKVALSGNPLTGGDPTWNSAGTAKDVQTDGKDISGVSLLFPSMTQITELDVSNCGLGPTSMPELEKLVRDASAVLATLKIAAADFGAVYALGAPSFCVGNLPSGSLGLQFRNSSNMDDRGDTMAKDGAVHIAIDQTDDWIQVAESKWLPKKYLVKMDTSRPCVFQIFCDALKTSQVTEVDFSHCGLGSPAMKILSDYVRDASAALTEVNTSGNPLTGGYVYSSGKIDKGDDISGVSILFPAMTKIVTLNISNCGLGPRAMVELSKLVRDASAVLKKVTLSNNFLFGSKDDGWGGNDHDVDADQSGWSAMCDALPGSPVEELDVTDVGMGVTGVTSLAKAISSMAAVTALNVISNAIGEPGGDLLIDIFQRESRIQTMLGIEDGTTTLDVSGERYGTQNLDTGCAKLLATEFSAGRRTRAITKVVLHDNRDLCDAGLAAIWDALPPHVSLVPKFQRCGLTTVPKQLFDKPDTTAIDLSDNDIDHLPWELLTLTNLTELKLEGNERLRTVHDINSQQGVQGVFSYLRDLYREEPTWSYSLKMILAGPSMAGKSSLLNGLVAGKADLTTPDNRTVGLDIKLLQLSDHRRRTRNGLQLQFSCYDAGGHDEYADIH